MSFITKSQNFLNGLSFFKNPTHVFSQQELDRKTDSLMKKAMQSTAIKELYDKANSITTLGSNRQWKLEIRNRDNPKTNFADGFCEVHCRTICVQSDLLEARALEIFMFELTNAIQSPKLIDIYRRAFETNEIKCAEDYAKAIEQVEFEGAKMLFETKVKLAQEELPQDLKELLPSLTNKLNELDDYYRNTPFEDYWKSINEAPKFTYPNLHVQNYIDAYKKLKSRHKKLECMKYSFKIISRLLPMFGAAVAFLHYQNENMFLNSQ